MAMLWSIFTYCPRLSQLVKEIGSVKARFFVNLGILALLPSLICTLSCTLSQNLVDLRFQ